MLYYYLTIIPRGRVGYEMQIANEPRSAELAIIISYPTSASGIIVLLKTPTKTRWISPTRTNRKRQGTSAIHVSHVYQKLSTRERTRLDCMNENQNIAAMNINFLKTHRDSRILHSRTAEKTWQIMWWKRIFKWQPSKWLWIWIFGAVTKVRTTEKNYYLGRLLWSCLKPQAGFAEREKKLYCRLDCSSEWLHSLYL